jgi:uncharacterized membrane protein YdjX (TVP38/TMEM64 family)
LLGIAVCGWVASVIGYACFNAYDDGIDSYSFIALSLLLIGIPTMLASVVYAAKLMGKTILIFTLALSIGMFALYVLYKERFTESLATSSNEHIVTPERKAQCVKDCIGDLNEYCQAACELFTPSENNPQK